jgi:hypothetical protein
MNAIIYRRRREAMFTKASLVLILALLVAILVNQRACGLGSLGRVVQAQGPIEYKAVLTEIQVPFDGIAGRRNAKLYTTQDALDEYGKAGWQLVTQSYVPDSANGGQLREQQLIFVRK